MSREHKQIRISEHQLKEGLATADLPGEPVAYLTFTPADLAHRYDLTFQDSFDNLDDLKIALLEFPSGRRVAFIHHNGFPLDETEIYLDRDDWAREDILPDVLDALRIPERTISWHQSWPTSLSARQPASY